MMNELMSQVVFVVQTYISNNYMQLLQSQQASNEESETQYHLAFMISYSSLIPWLQKK